MKKVSANTTCEHFLLPNPTRLTHSIPICKTGTVYIKLTVKAICDVQSEHTVLMSLELYKFCINVLLLSQDSNNGKYSEGFPMNQNSMKRGEDKLQLTDEVT